ncbi:phage tail tape measure protein [Providencia alcalifaciens]|uniref:Tail tape measure protein, TIGR01760 family n=1 Tax=Providencia alcalifaciens 205/92 TaxID=1256988 RepID=A0AAV3M1S4_9GAMM|nr:phage tail tape measure protein [Providencia alcalifaciens]EUD09683.1 tail tape measure protein, TIGR01760 family [Providencia alcalifaciens 205/92]WGZ54505.1 phage tail tape measure protein [Providencia alcalifaciens]
MTELDFTLSLIDNITKPIRQVQSTVSTFANKSQMAFGNIAVGGAGLAGTFWSIKNLLDPAIEMNDAMMSASLQGINDGVMDKIAKDALKFASQYGKSSIDFVNSTTAISKAINHVSQQELPQLTRITNTTAAALKTSSEEATAYMGQMFNQFEQQANAVGHVKFAEDLAGKAVYMSKTFGVSMAEITGLMEGAKNAGTQFGVGIDEQLAVLGELQRTLGGESSGAYEAFLKTATDSAQKLGLSFVNASGQMLSMPDMLEKLQTKYGASIEGNLKAQKNIEAAFGDAAVVVKQLYGNVDILRKNIGFLGASDGMKRTTEQAAKLANPWERLMSIWQSIRIAIGMTLLPVITPLVNKMAEGGQTLVRWLTLFPNIARWVGYITLGILGFAAAGAAANIVMGIGKFIMSGFSIIVGLFNGVLKIGAATVWLYRSAILAWNIALKFIRGTLLAVRIAAMAAGVSFSFMSWPVLLVIGAIALLAYGIYKLIKHWDDIKAAIMNTMAFKVVSIAVQAFAAAAIQAWEWISNKWTEFTDYISDTLVFKTLCLMAEMVGEAFSQAWDLIIEGWENLTVWFDDFSFTDSFAAMAKGITDIFSGVWTWLEESFTRVYNGIVDVLNYLPGVNIETKSTGTVDGAPATASAAGLLIGSQLKDVEKGGISRQISNNRTQSVDNSRRFDNVNITVTNGMSPTDLAEWTALENG